MKRNLCRLPLLVGRYTDYTDDANDVAFVIPVFIDSIRPYSYDFELERQFSYVKSSLVQANALRKHTDVCDRRIPIYFLLEDRIFSRFACLYESLGIKSSRLLKFSCVDGVVKDRRVSKKLMALQDPVLSDYGELFVLDADYFVGRFDSYSVLEVSSIQGSCLGFLSYEKHVLMGTEMPSMAGWFVKWLLDSDPLWRQNGFDRSCSELSRFDSRYSIASDRLYHFVAGGLLRVPCERPDGFVEFCLGLDPLVGDDEFILSIWTTHHDPEFDRFEDIHMVGNIKLFSEADLSRDDLEGIGFLHVSTNSNEQDDWESCYHKAIGAVLY